MDYIKQIEEYIPFNEQENQDKSVILEFIKKFPHNILLRDNQIAHITSSGFIMNKTLDKVLFVHHNIRNTWAWTGGHADGDDDFLHVAIKEAKEETGLINVEPYNNKIISIDILPVFGHTRKNKYVNTHLHLSVAYILVASENETLIVNKSETSGVCWFDAEIINCHNFDEHDVYLYNKLIKKAKQITLL